MRANTGIYKILYIILLSIHIALASGLPPSDANKHPRRLSAGDIFCNGRGFDLTFLPYKTKSFSLVCWNRRTHEMRLFGIELHGFMFGLGLGARATIDYTAEFRTWNGTSPADHVMSRCTVSTITWVYGLWCAVCALSWRVMCS